MLAESDVLIHSFKEWAIAISALGSGKTIMLLRKGGIREASKKFQVKHQKVWLYPTYEHQKSQLLKPEYSTHVTEVRSGWHPATVEIQSYAEITNILEINSLEKLQQLEPYHIWNQLMVGDRFKWKPQQPLVILLLRVSNLPTPITIPYHQSYGGCKSWIDLQKPISLQDLKPVLTTDIYQQQVNEILNIIDRD
ncbi:conserved hypothetical protein [Hyella patelloides LEGE 07179]|uniref:DUF1802 family protein n=1 Tax=Hyella patelloides LEGE 07179 TaxID=945734 RepID=A0A563VU35_9CYAN|nr:DUF1802 family protein [Hyella patelloides]VEP14781.1 conserved hypothetical protein [Hyella patelloides LEGE 07179]